ncbi:MAG: hypothetical protein POELPBGB_00350 [Bacteroidia bacterium]|nr:hypothetical protein [Bacteroidia bacterium]
MVKKDPRIDAYIANAQPFAQPILKKLRTLVHKGCPEVEETIKWGMPSFDYKGAFCSMAAFKQHAVFGFWKGSLIKDKHNFLQERANQGGEAMGNMGRITSLKDLPPDSVIIDYVKQAKKLNDDNIKLPSRIKKAKPPVEVPDYFIAALKRSKKTLSNFESFSPSHKREYVLWITEAKTEATRVKRMETALEWIAEGKGKNWKYERK